MKKACLLILSLFVTAEFLSGCEINVNELVSNSSDYESSSTVFHESTVSQKIMDTDTDIDFYDSDTQTDTDDTSEPFFDTSAYKSMYVSGAPSVEILGDAKGSSAIVGILNCGDSVSFIKSVVTDRNNTEDSVSFIYCENLGNFGYIKNANLVDMYDEVSLGDSYYIISDFTPFYTDQFGNSVIRNFSKNDMVTVLAKLSSGVWRVSDKSGTIGYVGSALLSENKIETKVTSSKTEKNKSSKITSNKSEIEVESKAESKVESETESRTESVAESKTESSNESSVFVGAGDPPTSGYTVYSVDVDIGYLALRSKASYDSDSTIGQLYYGESVYVIDASGEFWYVYAASCGKYGYVSGNPDYLVYVEY